MTPCMGGWCGLREKCPHYSATGQNAPLAAYGVARKPAERLCMKGADGWRLIEGKSGEMRRYTVFPEALERVRHALESDLAEIRGELTS